MFQPLKRNPAFKKESGDIIIIEVLSNYYNNVSYWSPLPFSVGNDAILWGEYDDLQGSCWVYSTYVNSGNPAYWNSIVTFTFKSALVKKFALKEHPEWKNFTIAELESVSTK